jgi:hypothetical protein|tara:strand:+ start:163 stop:372 length:210 start_codon:yes stop_codon:yes gene_type:complete
MAQSEISKYDLEITELKSEIKILSERVAIIQNNHLKHIEDKINSINKIMYTIGVMVLGQLLFVITRALM